MRIVIRRLPYYDSVFLHISLKNTVKHGIMTDIFIVFVLLCLTFLAYKYYAYHNYYVGHSTYKYAILFISSLYFRPKKAFLQRVFRYSAVALSFPATYVPPFFIPAFSQRKSGGKSQSLFHKGIFSLISAVYLLASVIFLNIQVDF